MLAYSCLMEREPDWLSADEQAAWRQLVALVFRLPSALDAQLQRDAGISNFEYMVLSGLSEAESRTLRMSDLAAMASGSLSRLSHVVSRLEKRGWVRREPCPGDGRFVNAVLTDEGWAKVVATAPGHVEAVRGLVVNALSPQELAALGHASGTILATIASSPATSGVGVSGVPAGDASDAPGGCGGPSPCRAVPHAPA
jgi:DNA-binding MarR family transcriptional regulator